MSGTQHERIGTLCAELRLAALPDLYVAAAQAAAAHDASFGDFLEEVLRSEREVRRARAREMFARTAGFPAIKTLDGYDYRDHLLDFDGVPPQTLPSFLRDEGHRTDFVTVAEARAMLPVSQKQWRRLRRSSLWKGLPRTDRLRATGYLLRRTDVESLARLLPRLIGAAEANRMLGVRDVRTDKVDGLVAHGLLRMYDFHPSITRWRWRPQGFRRSLSGPAPQSGSMPRRSGGSGRPTRVPTGLRSNSASRFRPSVRPLRPPRFSLRLSSRMSGGPRCRCTGGRISWRRQVV